MSVATYTKSGAKASVPAKLDKAVFGVEVKNHQLLKDVYLSYLAAGRDNLAKTKSRGQVRGGGRKPWRQKGTGNARVGSRRNPIWTGGGVAFGPTGLENYVNKINLKAKRQALRQALSLAAKEDRLKVIETFNLSEAKTKAAEALLKKIEASGSVLLVIDKLDEPVLRATRNLANVKLITGNYLTVYDVLNADVLVVTKDALEAIQNWLTIPPAKAKGAK